MAVLLGSRNAGPFGGLSRTAQVATNIERVVVRKRQAHYCKRTVLRICAFIAAGHTLKDALAKTGILAPTKCTFWKWRHKWPEVAELYNSSVALAKDAGIIEVVEVPAASPAPAPKHETKPKASWADALFTGA